MMEQLTALRNEVAELARKLTALEAGASSVEGKGQHGSENLLAELLGKQVRFKLEGGAVVEGVLARYHLRCLRITTATGEQVVNSRSIDTLEVLGDGPGGPPRSRPSSGPRPPVKPRTGGKDKPKRRDGP